VTGHVPGPLQCSAPCYCPRLPLLSYTNDGGTAGFGVKDTNTDTFASGSVYSRGNNDVPNQPEGVGGAGGGAGAAGNLAAGGNGLSGISEIGFDFLQILVNQ
jgi:hypothetical protein